MSPYKITLLFGGSNGMYVNTILFSTATENESYTQIQNALITGYIFLGFTKAMELCEGID